MKRSIKFITTIKWRGQNLLISGMKRWYCYGWIRGCYVQLAKSVQGLMWETTKLWWNKSNKIQINGDMPCSWIGTLPIVKMSVLPKLIYGFNVISIKIPAGFFWKKKIDMLILKCMWKSQEPGITKIILKNKVEWFAVPDFKT